MLLLSLKYFEFFKELRKIGKIPGRAKRNTMDFGSMREYSTLGE